MPEQRTYLNKAQHPVGTRLLYRDLGSKGEPREVLITEWIVTGYAWRGLFTNEYSLSMCEEKTRRWHTEKPEVLDLLDPPTDGELATVPPRPRDDGIAVDRSGRDEEFLSDENDL